MILQLHVEDVIDQVADGQPHILDLQALSTIAVHRTGKDLRNDIDLGDTAVEVCSHFTGINDTYPEVAKATGGEVPYDFIIGGDLGAPEYDGVIWQCLSLSDAGRHAKRFNSTAIGVACLADPRVRPCSAKQMASLVDLCAVLSMAIKRDPFDCLRGHMELPNASSDPNKQCPGPLLPMKVLRDDVATARAELGLQLTLMAGVKL